jgi:hypothetical protein
VMSMASVRDAALNDSSSHYSSPSRRVNSETPPQRALVVRPYA